MYGRPKKHLLLVVLGEILFISVPNDLLKIQHLKICFKKLKATSYEQEIEETPRKEFKLANFMAQQLKKLLPQ